MTYTPEELEKILQAYERWLMREEGGMRADLSNVDLRRSDLHGSNLSNIAMMPEEESNEE